MGIAPEKSDHAILRVHGDAIAIRVLLGRWNDWSHRNIFQLPDPLERIAHLVPFNCKLMFVTDVLISAAAAAAEIRALRHDAMRRAFLKFDKLRFRKLFFFAHDLGRDRFAFDRVRNEYGLAAFTPDAFSAESNVLDI